MREGLAKKLPTHTGQEKDESEIKFGPFQLTQPARKQDDPSQQLCPSKI